MRVMPSAMRSNAALQRAEPGYLDGGIHRTPVRCDRGAEIAHRLEVAIEKAKRTHALAKEETTGRDATPEPQRESQERVVEIDRMCEAFAAVVDAKSPFTCSHSRGVAQVAAALALTLNLPPDRVRLVRRAALLHDLGKLAVPNAILDKASGLTEEEWEIVVQHPRLTQEILARIDDFAELAEIAGAHHEKLDGTGYPRGLMATQLPLEARILAVADIYQAMTEGRPYRPCMSHAETMKVLSGLAPHKLDSRCVAALDRIYAAEPARRQPFGIQPPRKEVSLDGSPETAPLRATASC